MKKITIQTVDTDVVILALYAFPCLQIDELWIEFGSGPNKKWFPIHEAIRVQNYEGILFWYTFTGCDTVSQFLGIGKTTAWKRWRENTELNEVFARFNYVFIS